MNADELRARCRQAKEASRILARASAAAKNQALRAIAEGLLQQGEAILQANRLDCEAAEREGLSAAMSDRLLLNAERLRGMASDVWVVADLPDPVGEMLDMRVLPNGLQIGRRRVPLGVIGAIYESRPNVTVDIAALALKSGNGVVLRSGREALRSSAALAEVVRGALAAAGLPPEAVQFIDSPDRSLVGELLRAREFIDLMVPRGGAELIRYVTESATMPVVAGGIGVCHTYVDRSADLDMALEVVHNAKARRPTICNALDTLLVHRDVASSFLPRLAERWEQHGVEMRCDQRALELLASRRLAVAAGEEDWGYEFLSLRAAVKVVDSLEEALAHIERYGSGHSEAIVTEDYSAAMRFLDEVDAAAVYVNASTQFTDGAQFGLGAEVGISTQRIHARGPMGLRELTTYKWIILGRGHTRP